MDTGYRLVLDGELYCRRCVCVISFSSHSNSLMCGHPNFRDKECIFLAELRVLPEETMAEMEVTSGLLPFKGHPYVSRLCGQTSPRIISYLQGLGNF